MSTERVVHVESGIRGSRRLRFLLLSLRSLLVDQSLVFFEEFPAFALVFPALALLDFFVVLVVLASHLLRRVEVARLLQSQNTYAGFALSRR